MHCPSPTKDLQHSSRMCTKSAWYSPQPAIPRTAVPSKIAMHRHLSEHLLPPLPLTHLRVHSQFPTSENRLTSLVRPTFSQTGRRKSGGRVSTAPTSLRATRLNPVRPFSGKRIFLVVQGQGGVGEATGRQDPHQELHAYKRLLVDGGHHNILVFLHVQLLIEGVTQPI